jgi:hypothetical protein
MRRGYLAAVALAALVLAVPMTSTAALEPATPTITSSSPASPANDNHPILNGTGPALTTIRIYTDSACNGPVAGTLVLDLLGNFQIPVEVADNSVTTFYATASDLSGTSPCSGGFTYVEDSTEPPAPAITAHPDLLSNDTSPTFEFTDVEPGVTFKCRLNTGAFPPCTSPQSYTVSDGTHTFYVEAVDAAGNESASTPFQWTVETVAPPPPVITSAPSNPSAVSSWLFQYTDGDPSAHFSCGLDNGGFTPCPASGFATGNLLDGPHTFRVKAVDDAQNQSGVTSYSWTIDTVRPLVTVTDAPPLLTNQTSASFSFVANKPASTYQCSLDGQAFAACSSPKLYAGLGNGSHTFAVRAIWITLVGPATEYTWTVDTVPPQTTISLGPPAASRSASATFAFTSSEPESTFACRLDGGGFVPCTSPKIYIGLGDGRHTFSVEAVDRAGNADPSAAGYSWQISGVGPPTQDLRPPQRVRQVKRNVGYGRLQLRWRNPGDSDFDHVSVFLSTKRSAPARTLVYTGRRQSYGNRRFRNGLYYRYLIVAYDRSDNASGGTPATVPPSALLRSPRDGRVVRRPPLLRWTPVRKATFYNVQVYYRGEKILSAWPAKPRRALARRWAYGGHRFSMRRGTYVWYVWPGFGPKAKSRYGQLLGQGMFKVR